MTAYLVNVAGCLATHEDAAVHLWRGICSREAGMPRPVQSVHETAWLLADHGGKAKVTDDTAKALFRMHVQQHVAFDYELLWQEKQQVEFQYFS